MTSIGLQWQSKLVLLLVLPAVAADVVLQAHWWLLADRPVALWTLALSSLLGLAAWLSRAATPAAAFAGFALCAALMFATAPLPFAPWRTALIPVVVLLLLTSLGTRLGRRRKLALGTAENKSGRNAAQVAANLGVAALISIPLAQAVVLSLRWLPLANPGVLFAPGVAALSEAAADTLSSELGQLFSAQPRMLTTLRAAPPGTDGAISLGGTLVGAFAAVLVATAGTLALGGSTLLLILSVSGALFGLFFDSLLGATLERRGWLNNDGVNFLSTLAAALFALVAAGLWPHSTLR
ncbi:MAG TPA: DUF92 domain-containing protein [Terracidiphilus sp.]|nr:DUF92 domain-containing protein [Terracidiphilus sp.]